MISMKSTRAHVRNHMACVHHRQAQVVDPTLPLPPSSNRFDQDNSCLDQFSRWSIQLILFTFRFQSFCVSSILVIITVSREMKVIDSELIFNICDPAWMLTLKIFRIMNEILKSSYMDIFKNKLKSLKVTKGMKDAGWRNY